MPTIINLKESTDSVVESTPTDTPPERLPAEVMDRIVEVLFDERRIPDNSKASPLGLEGNTLDRSAYSALCAIQRTSKAMYLRATPYIWKEYEGDIRGFCRLVGLFNRVREEEEFLVLEENDKEPEGHPIEWKYPTRLLWMASHLDRLIYRPIAEIALRYYYQTLLASSFKQYDFIQSRLDEADSDRRLFPSLDNLVLDLSRYEGCLSTKDGIEGSEIDRYKYDEGTFFFPTLDYTTFYVRNGEDGSYREYIDDGPALCILLDCLKKGFRFKQTCFRSGLARESLSSLIKIKSDSIVLHDLLSPDTECTRYTSTDFRNREIVWSFLSPFQSISCRLRVIEQMLMLLTYEERTMVLARPRSREAVYSKMINTIIKDWKSEGEPVDWRYHENAEDGVPRCKACGGKSNLHH